MAVKQYYSSPSHEISAFQSVSFLHCMPGFLGLFNTSLCFFSSIYYCNCNYLVYLLCVLIPQLNNLKGQRETLTAIGDDDAVPSC